MMIRAFVSSVLAGGVAAVTADSLPLTVFCSVVASAIGGAWYLQGRLSRIEKAIDRVETRLESCRERCNRD